MLEQLDGERRPGLRVPYFVGPLIVAAYVGYRLSEHAVHSWDVAVALDPDARIDAGAVPALWARLGLAAERFNGAGARRASARTEIVLQPTDGASAVTVRISEDALTWEPGEATGTARVRDRSSRSYGSSTAGSTRTAGRTTGWRCPADRTSAPSGRSSRGTERTPVSRRDPERTRVGGRVRPCPRECVRRPQASRMWICSPCGLKSASSSTGSVLALAMPWGVLVSNSAASPGPSVVTLSPSFRCSVPART